MKPQGKNMMSTSATQDGHNNNKNNRSICKARNVSKHTQSWREILTLTLILPLNLIITLNTSPKPIPYLECFYDDKIHLCSTVKGLFDYRIRIQIHSESLFIFTGSEFKLLIQIHCESGSASDNRIATKCTTPHDTVFLRIHPVAPSSWLVAVRMYWQCEVSKIAWLVSDVFPQLLENCVYKYFTNWSTLQSTDRIMQYLVL